MCDLEWPLNVIQGVCADFAARCFRVNKVAVFRVHKRSIIDLLYKKLSYHRETARQLRMYTQAG